MVEPLPYAAPELQDGSTSLQVSDDRVVLTIMPIRGVVLGLLVLSTVMCAALWAFWGAMLWQFFGIRNLLPALSWSWKILGLGIVYVAFPLCWAVELTLRWLHYRKHGPVPVQLDASRDGILFTQPGLLRAVKRRHWPKLEIGRVDVDRVADIFRRRPRVGVRIRSQSNRTLSLVHTRGDEALAEKAAIEVRRVLGFGLVPEAERESCEK